MDQVLIGNIRTKRGRRFAKKILLHEKIRVSDKFTCNASLWVADTPQSHLNPTICLTLQHGEHKISLCFENAADLVLAVSDLKEWVDINSARIDQAHKEAVKEHLEFQSKMNHIDDYTDLTVIQGEPGENGESKHYLFNQKTGEILHEIEVLK
jgi:hypothetical protein